jgi:DNA helicase IV
VLADSLAKTHVTIVSEYHGLEREVVIVVADESYVLDAGRSELARRDLYIACTRTRSLLYVVATLKVIRHLKALGRDDAEPG